MNQNNNDELLLMEGIIYILNIASYNYYNLNKSLITDKEYDETYDLLKAFEKHSNKILPDSPSQNVGFNVSNESENTSNNEANEELIEFFKNHDIQKSSKDINQEIPENSASKKIQEQVINKNEAIDKQFEASHQEINKNLPSKIAPENIVEQDKQAESSFEPLSLSQKLHSELQENYEIAIKPIESAINQCQNFILPFIPPAKLLSLIQRMSLADDMHFETLTKLNKVKHQNKILSLDKTKSKDELLKWIGNNEGLLSWKLDGLTVVLNYKNGILDSALTRGNGEVGEDITNNAKFFRNIPLKIPFNDDFSVRGEALISFVEFENINKNEDEKYKNPRNLVSGTVRQLNPKIVANRNVDFFAFTLVSNIENKKKTEDLKILKDYGFSVVDSQLVDEENILKKVGEFLNKIENYEYTTDGLVLTFNDIEYSKSLGATSKFPKDSIAFKWADDTAETTLIDIIWNTSRTGRINPVAVFDSVELEGTSVKQASVHNLSILEDLELGIGDTITVYKANMIIPQIDDNLSRTNKIKIPDKCPICESETIIKENEGVKYLFCPNLSCPAQIIKGLSHFTSRNAMNIEGFSEKTIEKFVDEGYIKDYLDIFKLKEYEDKILELKGFGKKSYENIINAVENSKNVNLANLIYALGIEQVGLSNAVLLAEHFSYDFEKIRQTNIEDFESIEGFGPIISENLYKYFNNENNSKKIDSLLKYINYEKSEVLDISKQTLDGQSFVITGKLESYKNRKDLENLIKSFGGNVRTSVSSNTSFLINNDILSNSSKNKTAKDLSVEIISEEDFNKRFL